MSREEVIANIGAIAKSGAHELRQRIEEAPSRNMISDLIGQFGVGFYSSFMVASRGALVTRKTGETTVTKWESTGDGAYVLSDAD